MPAHLEEHRHEFSVQTQELRTQLHKDSQEQQELLDQQHDVIQQLEQQKQSLQVIVAMQFVSLMCKHPASTFHRLPSLPVHDVSKDACQRQHSCSNSFMLPLHTG